MFGLAWTKSFCQPFNRIAHVFAVIACACPVFLGMAERDNICGYCARVVRSRIGNRNPMILSNSMPKSCWPTADGAPMIPIVQTALPIFLFELMRKVEFSHSSFVALVFSVIRMRKPILATILPILFGVCILVFPACPEIILMFNRGSSPSRLSTEFSVPFWILLPHFPVLFAFSVRIIYFPLSRVFHIAFFTKRLCAIFRFFIFGQIGIEDILFADATNFRKRQGFIDHSDLTFACSHAVCSQGGVSAAFSLIGLDY